MLFKEGKEGDELMTGKDKEGISNRDPGCAAAVCGEIIVEGG